jgi:hypothetical protein
VSYTYGRTRDSDRTSGERFDADFDQRHALNVYGLYQLTDRTNLSVKFRTSSNFPIVGYVAEVPATDDRPVPEDQPGLYAVAADRNTARLPIYSRLDLRANRTFKVSTGRLTLYVELLNVFGHTNWRTGEGTILPNGDLRRLLRPLVPFVPSAGLLWEF